LRVDQSGEAELSLDVALALLAFVNALAELLGVLIVEKERETGDVLDGAGAANEHLKLLHVVVVVDDLDWTPQVLTVLVAGGYTMTLTRVLGAMF